MPCKSATLVIALLATFGVSALMTAQEDTTQRSSAGDTVNMNLSPGQYQVTASADDRMRVYPFTKNGSPRLIPPPNVR